MPAVTDAAPGQNDDSEQDQEFEEGKAPLLLRRNQGKVYDPANAGDGGQEEADGHAASIVIGQAGRDPVGPGKIAQGSPLELVQIFTVDAIQFLSRIHDAGGAAFSDLVRLFVGLHYRAERIAVASEHGFDTPVGVGEASASVLPARTEKSGQTFLARTMRAERRIRQRGALDNV